jgi:transcriptional regulator GlxA family with amidase domain
MLYIYRVVLKEFPRYSVGDVIVSREGRPFSSLVTCDIFEIRAFGAPRACRSNLAPIQRMGFRNFQIILYNDADDERQQQRSELQNNCSMLNVGIYIYDHAEVLDFSGPFEVFTTASRVATGDDGAPPFNTFLISEHGTLVQARGGYQILPNYSFESLFLDPAMTNIDVLIVVGGVHTVEMEKPAVLEWIQNISKTAKIVASVCTGAFILAKAGILTKKHKVTTHWDDIRGLKEQFPDLTVVENTNTNTNMNTRWVDEGNVVTSGGISAGIDMSLHLVERLSSRELAERTARQMEFRWTENKSY